MKTPSVLLFDLDGTLIDSLPDLALALNLLRAELDVPALSQEQAGAMVGDGVSLLVQRALGDDLFKPEHVLRFLELYDLHLLDNTRCYEGIKDLLQSHPARRMGVVTNKPHGQTIEILSGLGLQGHFGVIIGGDSLERKKPDPLPVQKALETLGADARQAVMIGDHHTDIKAGRAAGTATCFCTYGFGSNGGLASNFQAHAAGDLLDLFPGA
ncbi:HAD family hydrolase [Desulfospira joergensenii]|uniref:HAD family hydrolase n=1 Tax=Desulfospira joergensenii TaxID=53329 RepID=UPI0003B47E2F|nr:HAD-IA family hydrolase [Desulfospira joergensenii]